MSTAAERKNAYIGKLMVALGLAFFLTFIWAAGYISETLFSILLLLLHLQVLGLIWSRSKRVGWPAWLIVPLALFVPVAVLYAIILIFVGERDDAQLASGQHAKREPIFGTPNLSQNAPGAGQGVLLDQLEQLSRMRKEGTLSEAEFAKLKREMIGRSA